MVEQLGAALKSLTAGVETLNGIFFSEVTVFVMLATGVLFTVWSKFGQWRALTHGVAVIRGKYDRKDDPGAINHFQALSAALSATVGLGNIGGVAIAIALGGPGAVLWMWLIGLLGMALKMTEVIQSMLYRHTDDPDNPHGGSMYVARDGLARMGYPVIGKIVGGIFVVTLLAAAAGAGNMFQAWNVADVTQRYFGIPQMVTGLVLAIVVGMVIIGGIKRIGAFAGRIVPVMFVLYLASALYVLAFDLQAIPGVLLSIVQNGLPAWLGGTNAAPEGAFIGGSVGFAAMWGIKRALFSSEVAQGTAPMAHSAAKTDEPVREGVVAGLEPFIDTIVICTLTALVILVTGAHARPPDAYFAPDAEVRVVEVGHTSDTTRWSIESPPLPPLLRESKRVMGVVQGSGWADAGSHVFVMLHADPDPGTGTDLVRLQGKITGNEDDGWTATWSTIDAKTQPRLVSDPARGVGVTVNYTGASLTAHAFDRANPGLGKWLVVLASWLFALSTMISWSYYGEQGVVYLFGDRQVLLYKLIYCALAFISTIGFITNSETLDAWSTIGMGPMLWANIPIMILFGRQAMRAYHDYNRRLDAHAFQSHPPPPMSDVIDGKDVE